MKRGRGGRFQFLIKLELFIVRPSGARGASTRERNCGKRFGSIGGTISTRLTERFVRILIFERPTLSKSFSLASRMLNTQLCNSSRLDRAFAILLMRKRLFHLSVAHVIIISPANNAEKTGSALGISARA